MIFRFMFASFVFITTLSVGFAEDIAIEPVIAPLPDAVIIQHWKERVANTKTIYAEFYSWNYDNVFKTVSKGKGKLFIKGKNQCRLEIVPRHEKEVKLAEGEKAWRKIIKREHQFWIWKKNNTLTMINPEEKSFSVQKVNINTEPSSFWNWDLSLNILPWYPIITPYAKRKHPPKITVDTSADAYILTFRPTSRKDASIWSEIKLLLDMRTEKLLGIQIKNPARTNTTAWCFTKLEINQHTKDDKGLFDFSLKGYEDLNIRYEKERKKRELAEKMKPKVKPAPSKTMHYLKLPWRVWHLI